MKERDRAININYKKVLTEVTLVAGSESSIDEVLLKSFKIIGESLKLSRVYYFSYNRKKHTISNNYEWVENSISRQKDNLQDIPCQDVQWFYNQLISKSIIKFNNIDNIPDKSVFKILSNQSILSLLAVPVYVDNNFEGFVGFDQCDYNREWNECEELIVSTLAIMSSRCIKDLRLEEALQNEHKQLLAMVDNLGGVSYATELDTYKIVYANKSLNDLFGEPLEGRICYETLQGRSEPCDFCTNKYIIDSNDSYSWEYYSPVLKKHFHLIDRIVTFPNGKRVRFEVGFDITKLKEYTDSLHTEKELLRITLMAIGHPIITTDKNGNICILNEAAEELLKIKSDDVVGKKITEVYNPLNHKKNSYTDSVMRCIQSSEIINNRQCYYERGDNNTMILSECASPIIDDNGDVIGGIVVLQNETARVKRDETIKYLSTRDSLTGLYNRGYCETIISNLDIDDNLPISVIVGDVNGLKLTNDVFGHDQGDILLKEIGDIIKKACPTDSLVARWGGDEFVAFIPKSTSKQALDITKAIKDNCNNPDNVLWPFSISLGFATKQDIDEDLEETHKHAEDYMYKYKLIESRKLRSEFIKNMQHRLYDKTYENPDHIERIKDLSVKIGQYFDLPDNMIDQLKEIAKYHDVGKVSVCKDILLKTDKLTKEEWKKLKRHPEIGYRIVKALPELAHVAESVLCVRERYDGKGYPQKLAGKDIPLLARIVAVADAYDAMVTKRPYREALSKEMACKELRNNSGKKFDPEVVWCLINKILSNNE